MLPTIIEVSYLNSDLRVELVLTNKMNLIKDKSGDGKSKTLKDIFHSIYEKVEGIIVKSDYIIDNLDINKLEDENVFKDENKLFIIDENINYILSYKKFTDKYKNAKCLFLIVSREFLNTGYLNLNAVSVFKSKENLLYNEVYFSYTDLILSDINNETIIITEDETSGNIFFNNYFEQKCISARGRNKISEELSKYENADILLIADAAQLGGKIKEIINIIELKNLNVKFFLPQSFEFDKFVDEDKFNLIINSNIDYMKCINNNTNLIIRRYFKL